MIRLARSQLQPIGLDLGHDSLKMLQLEAVGEVLEVRCAAKMAIPQEVRHDPELCMAAASGMIRRMLREHPFSGRRVVAALPRHILQVKNVRLPAMPANELESVVQYEADNLFGFDAGAAQVRHLPAGEVRQGRDVKQEVIVLAAGRAEVSAFLEHLHAAGVVVASLDAEPCALYRSIERFIRRREDEQEVHVLVDVGERRTHVVIGRGRTIIFYKPIEIGGRHLSEAVSERLRIPLEEARALRRRMVQDGCGVAPPDVEGAGPQADARAPLSDPVRQAIHDATRIAMEALGREIALCLRYCLVTFRGQRPNRLRLVGGEGCNPQLQAVLNGILPIPAEAGRPLCNVNASRMNYADGHTGEDRRGMNGEWAVALGLGMKLSSGRFGLRDGTPRESSTAVSACGLAGNEQEESAKPQAGTDGQLPIENGPSAIGDVPAPGEAVHA